MSKKKLTKEEIEKIKKLNHNKVKKLVDEQTVIK